MWIDRGDMFVCSRDLPALRSNYDPKICDPVSAISNWNGATPVAIAVQRPGLSIEGP
jgi:hypothetical protein